VRGTRARSLALAAAPLLVASGFGVLQGGSDAVAYGTLGAEPGKGATSTAVTFTTSGTCAAGTASAVFAVTGAGFARVSEIALPEPLAAKSRLAVPLGTTWEELARGSGVAVPLAGAATLTLACLDADAAGTGLFTSAVTFSGRADEPLEEGLMPSFDPPDAPVASPEPARTAPPTAAPTATSIPTPAAEPTAAEPTAAEPTAAAVPTATATPARTAAPPPWATLPPDLVSSARGDDESEPDGPGKDGGRDAQRDEDAEPDEVVRLAPAFLPAAAPGAAPTPFPTPEPSPTGSPEPAPASAPSPTPEPTGTPEPTPEPTPEAVPGPGAPDPRPAESAGRLASSLTGGQFTVTPMPSAPPAHTADAGPDRLRTTDAPPNSFFWTVPAAGQQIALDTRLVGDFLSSTGQIAAVEVTDTREGGPAWTISGQIADFTPALPGRYMGWRPMVLEGLAGVNAGAEVHPGSQTGGPGLRVPSLLGSADSGHPPGTASLGAELNLALPRQTPAGTYTTVLTITALS
jgi:hypothetical protein